MDRPTRDTIAPIFGAPFAGFLTEPILVIGRDQWNRLDLADMAITQLRAARIVSALAAEYSAKSTADLYHKLSPASLAHNHGTGLHSLYVLWRAFEAKGLDPTTWYWEGRAGAIVTFTSLKAREQRQATLEKKSQPRRAQVASREAKRQSKRKG